MKSFSRLLNALACLRFLIVLFSLTLVARVEAQQLAETPVYFSYITVNEGLASNTVRALLQDRYGYIWIGTSRGLNRYDGHSIVQYPTTRSMTVTSLYELGDTVWIGTEKGLYLYSQPLDSVICFKSDNKKISLYNTNVSNFSADSKGCLWIATMGQGILRIGRGGIGVDAITTPNNDKVYGKVFVDRLDEVWATTNWAYSSLVKFDRLRGVFDEYKLDFGTDRKVNYRSIALTQSKDGIMWLATANGSLVKFNSTSRSAVEVLTPEMSGITNAHSIIEIKEGTLLIGSDKGLLLYSTEEESLRLHTTATGIRGSLSDNFVYPIISDRESGTWVGTYYGGINYYHPTTSDFASHVQSLHYNSVAGNVINHFCEDKYGRIWVASDDGGLTLYKPKEKFYLPVPLTNSGVHNVHALCTLGDKLYVGTYGQGMDVVDINTLAVENIPVFVDEKGKAIEKSSYEMFVDAQGCLWVGTFYDACIYDPVNKVFKVMKKLNSTVVDIKQSRTGEIWFATESSGVWSYSHKSKQWKHYEGEKLGAASKETGVMTNGLCLDSKGTLWLGTSNGLMRYDAKSDRFETVRISYSALSVLALEANGDDLWLATSIGLCRYSIKEKKVMQIYKGGGNLVSTDFLPSAIMRAMNGEMYVGTTHGFVSFNPKQMHHNDVVPKVVFTGLEIFNHPVPVGSELLPKSLNHIDELRLSHTQNVIRINYSAMSYVQPTDNMYSYYLEGFETEWVNAGNHHSVTYTNLAPGTYVLHVRATNNDGVLSEDTTLKIVITPPFYWNTTAQIIYILLICAGIYYLIYRIVRKEERRHEAEIEQINTQKEQAIQEIHIRKEQEIKEINTQKEQEIHEINTQKEQAIQEISLQKEQEVHDARIKFMTITPRDQEFLDKMEEVIEQNFSNPDLTVDQIASAIGISRTGLFTKLKTLADVTPNEMIQVIRLKHAAALLQENRYRVSEVCYMVGFSSPSYFSKCFQKQYGVTPAKYV